MGHCPIGTAQPMPAYFFWGDDDFQLQAAVQALRQQTLDETWASFNYDVIPATVANGPVQALNQAMTPPFGLGKRFVWLQNTSLGQRCPDEILVELERTLPTLPAESVLLLTSPNKPDGRSKFTNSSKVRRHSRICRHSALENRPHSSAGRIGGQGSLPVVSAKNR